MSNSKNIVVKQNMLVIKPLKSKVPQIPIFINKKNKITLLKGERGKEILQNISLKQTFFQEDLIYESKPGDSFIGDSHSVRIVNRKNLLTNSSRTIAKYTSVADSLAYIETSDSISKLIGQESYDTVFSALCSVINQEAKIRGMLALLRTPKKLIETEIQTDMNSSSSDTKPSVMEKCCQTTENSMELIYRFKKCKRPLKRSTLTPYIVTDHPKEKKKKLVLHPDTVLKTHNLKKDVKRGIKLEMMEKSDHTKDDPLGLPEIKDYLNEDSNDGSIGNMSSISGLSHISNANYTQTLLDKIQERTSNEMHAHDELSDMEEHNLEIDIEPTYIKMPDDSQILVTVKPEDKFHIATHEILKNVTTDERKKLLWYQAYIDWKCCLERDEDDYLPIHSAVQNNDLDLLRRQCLVLRNRQESLDITAGNYTALQMSICQDTPQCTAMLLHYGADPLFTDEEERTLLHLAAEATPVHLRALLQHCRSHARQILQEHDMWTPGLDYWSDEQLATHLMAQMCDMFDCQGYTPIMTASRIGNFSNVKLLADTCPLSVNKMMPNSGNTPLFVAVSAACIDAGGSGNRSKVADHFYKTIEVLIESGADPSIDNYSGATVNDLLTEFNIVELNLLLANKLTSVKYGIDTGEGIKNFDTVMLVKDEKGTINIKDIIENKNFKDRPNVGHNDKTVAKRTKGDISKVQGEDKETKIDTGEGIKNFDTVMLVKDEKRTVNIKDIIDNKNYKDRPNVVDNDKTVAKRTKGDINKVQCEDKETKTIKVEKDVKDKPIILENIALPAMSVVKRESTPGSSQSLASDLKIVSPKDKIITTIKVPLSITIKDIRTLQIDEPQSSVLSIKNKDVNKAPPANIYKKGMRVVQESQRTAIRRNALKSKYIRDKVNIVVDKVDNKRKISSPGPCAKKQNI